jgi:hypothetical protein
MAKAGAGTEAGALNLGRVFSQFGDAKALMNFSIGLGQGGVDAAKAFGGMLGTAAADSGSMKALLTIIGEVGNSKVGAEVLGAALSSFKSQESVGAFMKALHATPEGASALGKAMMEIGKDSKALILMFQQAGASTMGAGNLGLALGSFKNSQAIIAFVGGLGKNGAMAFGRMLGTEALGAGLSTKTGMALQSLIQTVSGSKNGAQNLGKVLGGFKGDNALDFLTGLGAKDSNAGKILGQFLVKTDLGKGAGKALSQLVQTVSSSGKASENLGVLLSSFKSSSFLEGFLTALGSNGAKSLGAFLGSTAANEEKWAGIISKAGGDAASARMFGETLSTFKDARSIAHALDGGKLNLASIEKLSGTSMGRAIDAFRESLGADAKALGRFDALVEKIGAEKMGQVLKALQGTENGTANFAALLGVLDDKGAKALGEVLAGLSETGIKNFATMLDAIGKNNIEGIKAFAAFLSELSGTKNGVKNFIALLNSPELGESGAKALGAMFGAMTDKGARNFAHLLDQIKSEKIAVLATFFNELGADGGKKFGVLMNFLEPSGVKAMATFFNNLTELGARRFAQLIKGLDVSKMEVVATFFNNLNDKGAANFANLLNSTNLRPEGLQALITVFSNLNTTGAANFAKMMNVIDAGKVEVLVAFFNAMGRPENANAAKNFAALLNSPVLGENGAVALGKMFNAMTETGAANFASFLNKIEPKGIVNFSLFLNRLGTEAFGGAHGAANFGLIMSGTLKIHFVVA